MKVVILDGARFHTKEAAHEYMQKTLEFPEYYGKNLDALADCLSELPRDKAVIVVNAKAARCALGGYADEIFETFTDILGRRFRVMIFE